MTVGTRTAPNFTTQSAAQYKANIDAAFGVDARLAGAFAPHQQDVGSPAPDMSVRVDAGGLWDGATFVEVAAQTVSGFTTPASGQVRVDRVVLDPATGVASRIAGTPQSVGSPTAVAPTITAGQLPICQIAFTASDTVITNSMIIDERATPHPGLPRATQAQQETGSSTDVVVTPGRQHYHPSAAKGWINGGSGGGTPTVGASYNVASLTDAGVGLIGINWSTAFSSAVYCAVGSTGEYAVNVYQMLIGSGADRSAGALSVQTVTPTGTNTDIAEWDVVAFGDR